MAKTNNSRGDKLIIVKDNALINASYNLELVEQRLILLAILEARESGKGINANNFLSVHASSYMDSFNVTRQAAYMALKAACDDLFARQFSYQTMSEKGNIKQHKSRWVSEIVYNELEATVQLIFAPAVVPLITRLEKHFTSYEIEQIAALKSKYAMRLYELLVAWKSTGKVPEIELEDFRGKLGLSETEYRAMGDFKKHVLDLAIKQINEHSNITASYEQHKKGRTITGFSFRFKAKQKKKELPAREDAQTGDLFVKLSDAQRHMLGAKLAKDPRVQSDYAQKLPSDTYEAFGKALADMLLEEKHFKTFLPILLELGYQPSKRPS
jgi:plasmid replication initiation protein